ncbi:MAG: phosphate ABC transporter ATP-binding protein PstB [Nitrososphaeraceae archaeon]|nr:phosphate ABC transporter ATP-binding protein PstB [Nitrososphaeraceae archaeon]MDW0235917.1 phosphate ABC transporter ATP-binding protein PstB [Nitrososphaeraceae archaeon]MDW0321830.1 phosphate ABC transporter ATP-binding protein PstB [Nitrososphaeraceae archaeon]MDW3668122.1 phosphate ABC transporter ATP-binding protein PstB [Nitrososphaeraceae archaeon]
MAIEEPIEADEAIIESASESISETKKVQDSTEKYKVRIEKVNGWYGAKRAIKDVNLNVKDNAVTAFIGPSGCGKTTLLRCLNRMHEMTPGAHADGRVVVDGIDIYDKSIDPVVIRRRIGMVFQKPNPFPTMSIFDNVAAGLRLNGMKNKTIIREIVEESLKNAALWEEVKNELDKPGMSLSGGQQQRLCIARALAMQPEVLLMDEPTSSLDPIGSSKIEELVRILKDSVTIIIVTHNMQQAARVSDFTAFMYLGDLIEYGATNQIFMKPEKELTERYISGKFG